MRLFSSVRVAPGIRLSATSRGLRAHVGPRFARMHVGGGRTGVSTGAGPFTVYESVGTPSPRAAGSAPVDGLTTAQAERARQVATVARAWELLESQHRMTFEPVAPPAPAEFTAVPMFPVLLERAEREALAGVSRFDRTARHAARAHARSHAEAEALRLLRDGIEEHRSRQRRLTESWAALTRGDRDAVTTAVTAVLGTRGIPPDVQAPSTGLVRVQVPMADPSELPTHLPGVTPAGAPTLKKLTKTQLAAHLRAATAARVLLVGKETLAASPATCAVALVATNRDGEAVLRATLGRQRLAAAPWDQDAWSVLSWVDPALQVDIGGRIQELRPLRGEG